MEICENSLTKKVQLHNQNTLKNIEENLVRTSLKIQTIFGINKDKIQGQTIIPTTKEQVIYYVKNMLVKYNLQNKKHEVIYENMGSDTTTKIKHLLFQNRLLIVIIKSVNRIPHIGIYWHNRTQKIQFYRIGCNEKEKVVDINYNEKKNLFYLLTYNIQTKKQSLKVLQVIEISKCSKHKAKLLIDLVIKKTGGITENLEKVLVGLNVDDIYLYGKGYFRLWKISFNLKVIKESNHRNIERSLKSEKVVDFFWLKESTGLQHKQWVLASITQNKVIFINNNEIVKISQIPKQSLFKGKKKESTEMTLQRSLNQIYKMKFNFEEEQESEVYIKNNKYEEKRMNNNITQLTSITFPWASLQKQTKFCATSKQGKVITYQILSDLSLKILSEVSMESKITSSKYIANSPDGRLIVIEDQQKNPYIINQSDCSSDMEGQLQYLWSNGHCHSKTIVSISTPRLNRIMTSLDSEGSLKLWNINERQKGLLLDVNFKTKPLEIDMHPCGFLIAINFGLQIKIFAIVSMELDEIVAIKTNDFCSNMMFSRNGAYLITNEKNLIKVYEPFTLSSIGSIQPQNLRLQIQNFQLSENGEYIVYQCSNSKVYRQKMQFSFKSNYQQSINCSIYCHTQSQIYTCYYFDFGTIKSESNGNNCSETNIFVGFTSKKYMVMYGDYGTNLIAQFPIQNCIITQIYVSKKILYAGTSTGNIRCYNWTILQSHCMMEISTNHIVRFIAPFFNQFKVWMDNSPISQIRKVQNRNQVIVGSTTGNIAILSLETIRKNKLVLQQVEGDRKKMINSMNGLRFVSIIESQRLKKLIDKTENDIVKIEHECGKEKQNKQKQIQAQERDKNKNIEKKRQFYTLERTQYIKKEFEELKELENQKLKKEEELEGTKNILDQKYQKNIKYEKDKTVRVEQILQQEKEKHKNNIKKLISTHKCLINKTKKTYLQQVKQMQKDFEENVLRKYKPEDVVQMKPLDVNPENNEQIIQRQLRVRELQQKIQEQEKVYDKLLVISDQAQQEDEQIQQQFQASLQKYNDERFKNLALHSQVLKMQNQLLEKKQVLNKKDEVIHLAYQEKYNYENYKELKHGSLYQIQKAKKAVYVDYNRKEKELKRIFQELMKEIKKADQKKIQIEKQRQKLTIVERQNQTLKKFQQDSIQKLKELKKFLLLEGSNDDSNQKYLYQQQQQLLARIKWLNKRFSLTLINEKKNIILKKNGISQVIKQNKNLLEECNQLRQEGIQFQNEINHLNQKLGEANKIIELERKLKRQKSNVAEQAYQLQNMKEMFKEQLRVSSEFQVEEI